MPAPHGGGRAGDGWPGPDSGAVDASEAELKAVPGIGDAYAAKIIAGRPYANKSQLKSRNILPAPAYDKVSELIIAKQAVKDAAKPAAKPVKK